MLAMGELPGLVPAWVITLMDKLPDPGLMRLRHYMKVAKGVAKQLVDRQLASHAAGLEGGKDVMSILGEFDLLYGAAHHAEFAQSAQTCPRIQSRR